MSLTAKDIEVLSAPFDRNTIGVKVQRYSGDKTKASLVLYLQHTDAYSRIEQVDPAWSFEVLDEQRHGEVFVTRGRLTIKGVSRTNVGDGNEPKGAASDAIKRCAMLFGVGRYLYDTETVWVPYNELTDKYKQFTYADFEKALRPNQEKPPVGQGPSPITTPPKPGPKPVQSKQALSVEILRVGTAMNMTKDECLAWAKEFSGKEPTQMTVGELEIFLNYLLSEAGRNGIAV